MDNLEVLTRTEGGAVVAAHTSNGSVLSYTGGTQTYSDTISTGKFTGAALDNFVPVGTVTITSSQTTASQIAGVAAAYSRAA
jgi:hypothetical protein